MKIEARIVVVTLDGGADSHDFVMEIPPHHNAVNVYWVDGQKVAGSDFDRALRLCDAGRKR